MYVLFFTLFRLLFDSIYSVEPFGYHVQSVSDKEICEAENPMISII